MPNPVKLRFNPSVQIILWNDFSGISSAETEKKSGTISLNKTLKSMLADTPLVKNLDNPEYLEIILDGSDTLEDRFEKIDSRIVIEKLKAEQKKYVKISPEMKKIIQRPDLPKRLALLLAVRNIGANRYLLS
ncbi:MAG: hypothetical protein LWX02_11610 [Deltaproteobacteria bacterium]|jgi:hypothetical protein|nr:hypothetical protein [Deltaproteobacteria bacterium]